MGRCSGGLLFATPRAYILPWINCLSISGVRIKEYSRRSGRGVAKEQTPPGQNIPEFFLDAGSLKEQTQLGQKEQTPLVHLQPL